MAILDAVRRESSWTSRRLNRARADVPWSVAWVSWLLKSILLPLAVMLLALHLFEPESGWLARSTGGRPAAPTQGVR